MYQMNPTRINTTPADFINMLKAGETRVVFQFNNDGYPGYWATIKLGQDTYLANCYLNPLQDHPAFDVAEIDQSGNRVRNNWVMSDSGTMRRTIGSKVSLVDNLMALGINQDVIKRLKTVKASELKEMLSEDGLNKEEMETIVLRLQQKSDTIKMTPDPKVAAGIYSQVVVAVVPEQYRNTLVYAVSVDVKDALNRAAKEMVTKLSTLKVAIYSAAQAR